MRIVSSLQSGMEPAVWDRFVAADARGHLLQTWAWGELKRAYGWTPVRLAVEQDGAWVAGAQVLYRRLGPLSVGYVPKGPVLVEDTAALAEALWQAVRAQSRRMGALALKVEPEWRDDDAARHAWLAAHGFAPSADCIQPRRTIIVDLKPSEDEILARMKQKWRYNVRLSERKGVEVRVGGADDMAAFHALMQVTGARDQFGVHTEDYYRRAWELFAPEERVRLLLASYEGKLLAGLMAFAFNGQAWYMYGASSDEHRELMPNHQLQWRAMQWARERGCVQYDLWGITDVDPDSASAELGGVQRFKEGFGGEVVRYVGAYDQVYCAPLYALLHKVRGLAR